MGFIKVIILLLILFSTSLTFSAQKAKILIITSYDWFDCRSSSQLEGFREGIQAWLHEVGGANVLVKGISLGFDSRHFQEKEMLAVSPLVVNLVDKYNIHDLYFIGDSAMKQVGLPIAHQGYKVKVDDNFKMMPYRIYYSDIHQPISRYIQSYGMENVLPDKNTACSNYQMCGYTSGFDMRKLFVLFGYAGFTPNKYYLITEDDGSEDKSVENTLLKSEYLRTFKEYNLDYELIPVSNLSELVFSLDLLNKNPKIGVIILCLQKLWNDKSLRSMTIEDIIRTVISINKKHLELSVYLDFVRIGLSMSCGPNYFEVGKAIAEDFRYRELGDTFCATNETGLTTGLIHQEGEEGIIDYLTNYGRVKLKRPNSNTVNETILSANIQRLNELGLRSIYKNNYKLITIEYAGYRKVISNE